MMDLKTCTNCFEEGYNGQLVKNKWLCSTCLEYNDVNTEALLDDDCIECECGTILTGWDKYCNQCGKIKNGNN